MRAQACIARVGSAVARLPVFLAFLTSASLAWTATAPPERREPYPARSGTSRAQIERFWKELAARRPALPRAVWDLGDRDLHGLALVEDDGTLLRVLAGGLRVTDTFAIIERFYQSHGDDYDFVCVFVSTAFPGDPSPEVGYAFESNVSNDVSGIGLPLFNLGQRFGPHVTRLRSIINMNDLGEFGEDPSEPLPYFLGSWSGLDVLGQEMLHSVGAFVDADNIGILGRDAAHWSFFFQTYGSFLEGNGWRDNGDGSFTTVRSAAGLSQLDRYLLGLLPAKEVVDPMYAIDNSSPSLTSVGGSGALPAEGITVQGARVPVTLQNITALFGSRIPDASTAPKEFNVAFVLLVPNGEDPPAHDIEKLDEFRHQWQELFRVETQGRGRMTSHLGSPAPVSADFEATRIAGEPGLTVTFDNDALGDATSFHWEFGNGETSNERHPTHTYARPGLFSVRLTVEGEGGPAVATRNGFVQVGTVFTWFADDFEESRGWRRDPSSTATSGTWVRVDPIESADRIAYGSSLVGAVVAPEDDHTPAGRLCWTTGFGYPGAAVGTDDVDDGFEALLSPRIDLSAATDPVLGFWHWFVNNGGTSPGRDPFHVDLSSDDGVTWVTARTFQSSHAYWREEHVRLRDFVEPSANVRIRFYVQDNGDPSIVEAAVDDVHIFDVDVTTAVEVSDVRAELSQKGVALSWSLGLDPTALSARVERAGRADGVFESVSPWLTPAPSMWFVDASARLGETYWYRVAVETASGWVASVPLQVTYQLLRQTAFAPPSRLADGRLLLRYVLGQRSTLRFSLYDVAGKRVMRFGDATRAAGSYSLEWTPLDAAGQPLPRGVYMLRLETEWEAIPQKIYLWR